MFKKYRILIKNMSRYLLNVIVDSVVLYFSEVAFTIVAVIEVFICLAYAVLYPTMHSLKVRGTSEKFNVQAYLVSLFIYLGGLTTAVLLYTLVMR